MTTSSFLAALQGRNSGPPPVWLMRQAGRYQSSYRRLRQRYSFLELCRQPELIVETTLLPVTEFDVDAAILFADILLLAEPLGLDLRFDDNIGPVITPNLQCAADVDRLPSNPDSVYTTFEATTQAIVMLKETLKIPLLGFAAAPFTLASYLIEGRTSRDLKRTKQWLYQDPVSFHKLLQKLTDYTIAYLNLQIAAGVDAVQLFDSWAHALSPVDFASISMHYTQQIQNALPPHAPLIFFCRGTGAYLPQIARAGIQCLSLDWTCELSQARHMLPNAVLQGNLDPAWLLAPHTQLRNAVHSLLQSMDGDPSYIFNLGHGITPDVSVDAVRCLIDAVHSYVPQKTHVTSN
jgi:uroporphyrinogen decarboxylase